MTRHEHDLTFAGWGQAVCLVVIFFCGYIIAQRQIRADIKEEQKAETK